MQCRNVLTRIDALRTGELDPNVSHEVESHLEKCESCHDSLDDVAQFASIVSDLKALPTKSCKDAVCEATFDSFDTFEVDGQSVWVGFSSRGIRMVDLRSKNEDDFRAAYDDRYARCLRAGTLDEKRRRAIENAVRGEAIELPDVDLQGLTDFEQEVLRTITRIPRGEVRSYEWVARQVHRPRATRAVGTVMARNPIPFVLPCHRVVPSTGEIGNYGYGPEMKRRLLEAEGAPVEQIESLARRGVKFLGSATTKIFCFPTCKDARRIQEKNQVGFHSVADAEHAGFRPCKRCLPAAIGA